MNYLVSETSTYPAEIVELLDSPEKSGLTSNFFKIPTETVRTIIFYIYGENIYGQFMFSK